MTFSNFDCSIFNTDKILFNALTGNDALLVNRAIQCLKEKFIQSFSNSGYYRNKWYADDCLMIAIDQFMAYIKGATFILGEKPLILGLYIIFKRRIIDFERKELRHNELKKNLMTYSEDFYEKMQVEAERETTLDAAIALLRKNCQSILRMKYFEQLTTLQIAEAKQLKPESIFVETNRCKKELKLILIDKFNFPPHGLWI